MAKKYERTTDKAVTAQPGGLMDSHFDRFSLEALLKAGRHHDAPLIAAIRRVAAGMNIPKDHF